MRYIALDPGETTGVATLEVKSGVTFALDEVQRDHLIATKPAQQYTWKFDQIGPQPHHAYLYGLLFDYKPDVVICERFNYEPNRQNVILTSVEYIGVVKLYAQAMQKGCTLVMQPRRIGNQLFPQAKCEKLGLWQPGKPHACDAMQHMLYYLTTAEHNYTWVNQLKPV